MKKAEENLIEFTLGGKVIVASVEKRSKVPVLTLRCLEGGLIVLPDSANQIGLVIGRK